MNFCGSRACLRGILQSAVGAGVGAAVGASLLAKASPGFARKIVSPVSRAGSLPHKRVLFQIWLLSLLLPLPLLLLEPHVCPDDANAHHRRPNAGAVMGVARQDAAPAAMGHVWPVAACPHNSAGERAPGEPRRPRPFGRAGTFWFLLGPSKRDSP